MVDANLLVTHDPSRAGSAKEEIEKALKVIRQKAKFLKSEIEGVFKLRVSNPKKLVKSLSKLKGKKGMFKHTFYWTPVEKWTPANVKSLQKEIKKLQKGIKKTEKWKMDLHKRHFDQMHSTELIMKLTEVVDKPKVDLDNPQKIIEVQIIGKKAGLALLNKDEMLIIKHK
ncbi:MAG: THUMP domain-containing protein [Nanoarchaeota archaeon]|nr:THUMP domain-containing protein [Nanoarchaeota archaeon]